MTATTKPAPRRTSPRAGTAASIESAHRRLGRVLVAIALMWAVVGLYVVHSQLPSNALTLPGQDDLRPDIQVIAPQGWAFFTRSPRHPYLLAWRPGATADWQVAMLAPHAEPRNAFGFNRRSRAQPVEMALLGNLAPPERWVDCEDGDIAACLTAAPAVAVTNPTPEPLLCGPVGLSSQEPLPWAWAEAAGTTRMPAIVLRLEVRC
jgi:antimicrobial peptide system SdpA family protein